MKPPSRASSHQSGAVQLVINIHLNRIPDPPCGKGGLRYGRIQFVLAAVDVELPSVPGTGDDASVESAFAQRSPLVGANTVKGNDLAFDVKQRQDPVLGAVGLLQSVAC